MGITLSVGITKKVGLPNYGSAGSLCNLEIELDASVLERPEEFHRRVREAYVACRTAVEDELKNHAAHQAQTQEAAKQATPAPAQPEPVVDRRPTQPAPVHNAPHTASGSRGEPSPKQRDYIQQLARQTKLGSGQKLERLCEQMYKKPLTSLTGVEASNLIDTLRAVKAGNLSLAAL